jgi:hypothetical protein
MRREDTLEDRSVGVYGLFFEFQRQIILNRYLKEKVNHGGTTGYHVAAWCSRRMVVKDRVGEEY